ncbi:MAG: alpha-glucan family phosphorylase [Lewinellaceae bacterium]|nr:alpha-glucan family phosphorylase [Saprospiraceae bacterium]MCB9337890.1 alpha-glucan family phosphorylase [Lewinellaceae bacterium]
MDAFLSFKHPYPTSRKYNQKVAYFSMEFAIDQALKIYSGGLGYLAGSHMRSAYDLKQNLVGIGILWKYGYYDQTRNSTGEMDVLFMERLYNFLVDTGIEFEIPVNSHHVKVKVFYLPPHVFGSAPLFLLSTNHPDNDYLAQTISHRLYSNNTEAKIAQSILLGRGGAKLLDLIGYQPDVYHLNEAHALPAAFYLYEKLGVLDEVRNKMAFTTHTPVEAGNEKHDIYQLEKMSFFGSVLLADVRRITGIDDNVFNHTLAALRLSKMANGVSKLHGEVARSMWGSYDDICPITHITNSQNHLYWHDPALDKALADGDKASFLNRKKALKQQLFQIVADQTGKIFDPDVLTLVWARRYAGYKRADLITRDISRFERLVYHSKYPIQLIWAGKPYPMDYDAIGTFNKLVSIAKRYPNVAVVTGYELALSKALKQGSDIWLNNPRVPREASGTSGMTAAMNASVNLSTLDGWIPEFAKPGHNAFTVPLADDHMPDEVQDEFDRHNLMDMLENEILPTYYDKPDRWLAIVQNSMKEVVKFFDSDRMADEYYKKLYGARVMDLV